MDKILVKYPKNWGLDSVKVENIGNKVLKKFNFSFKVELSIFFVGRRKAKDLNIKYRKMDYVPQVLGFPNSQDTDPDGWVRLGDVVICTDRLKEEMKLVSNKNRSIYEILEEWIEHGVENLLK